MVLRRTFPHRIQPVNIRPVVLIYPNAAHEEVNGRGNRDGFSGDIQSDIVFAELINLLQPFVDQFFPEEGNI